MISLSFRDQSKGILRYLGCGICKADYQKKKKEKKEIPGGGDSGTNDEASFPLLLNTKLYLHGRHLISWELLGE